MTTLKTRIQSKHTAYDDKDVLLFHTEHPDTVASFAMALIEKHAMIAANGDGEDSSGRAKLRLQTPEELVERSFRIAELTMEKARSTGHMVALPDLTEINADIDAKRAEETRVKAERQAAQRA